MAVLLHHLQCLVPQGLVIDTDTGASDSKEYGLSSNPVTAIKAIAAGAPKDRALSMSEIATLWTALDEVSTYQTEGVLKLILVTGCRVEEILRAKWSEINKETNALEIPRTRHKKHLAHTVPLSDLAVEIINSLPQLKNNDYLFPHRDEENEYMRSDSLAKATSRLCARHSIAAFTPRDLRRTVKTHMARIGIPKEIMDRIQGHSMTDVSSVHYNQYTYWPEKQEALRKWGNELLKALGKSQSKIIYPDFSAH